MFSESRPARTRKEQKAFTAAAVLEAARDEFERVGFERANLRDIALAAEVSAGTVLHHFGDKRQLLYAALFDDLDRTLREALRKPGPPPLDRQLHRLGEAVFELYRRRPKLSRELLKESLFADPPWAQRFIAQTAEVRDAVSRLHVDAVARKELRAGDDLLAGVAWLSFFYFALLSWVQRAVEDPLPMLDALSHQHLEARRPRRKR